MKNMNIENHDGHIWKQVEYLTFKHHRAEKKTMAIPSLGIRGIAISFQRTMTHVLGTNMVKHAAFPVDYNDPNNEQWKLGSEVSVYPHL